jgi:hypothetical protein
MATCSLYRRLLGPLYDELPEVLRRFHDAPDGHRARGWLDVARGRGLLRNAIAWILGMPAAGSGVEVELAIAVEGTRERWVRHFGGQRVETVQWADGGLLMESLGPTSFASGVHADGSGLHYVFRRAWLGPLPFPRWFSPRISGEAIGEGDAWRVTVRIEAPIVGLLIRYEGPVRPVEEALGSGPATLIHRPEGGPES